MQWRHVVAATDFSQSAEEAAHCAARLATEFGAVLSLVTVSESPHAKDRLAALSDRIDAPEQTATVVVAGRSPSVLVEWLHTTGADVLFCGPDGLGITGLFGGFVDKLLRLTPCPIWIARHATLPQSILLSTDLEQVSSNAQCLALELSQQLERALHAVHVLPRPPFRFGRAIDLEAHFSRALDGATGALEHALGRSASIRVLTGDPTTEILAWVSPDQLIICGTHGRTGLERWLVGSVADKLLRRSPSSVLVVPPFCGTPDSY